MIKIEKQDLIDIIDIKKKYKSKPYNLSKKVLQENVVQ